MCQIGFAGVASPVRALQAAVAAASSPLWDSGAADYLLGVPIVEGLQTLRNLISSDADCVQCELGLMLPVSLPILGYIHDTKHQT